MISIFLVSRKVLAPVIEFYRVACDTGTSKEPMFRDDKALHDALMGEIDALQKGTESNAVAVDSQVLPYDEKANPPKLMSAKAENSAIAAAAAEAQKRSIIEAKKKAVTLASDVKAGKASKK